MNTATLCEHEIAVLATVGAKLTHEITYSAVATQALEVLKRRHLVEVTISGSYRITTDGRNVLRSENSNHSAVQ